MTTRPPVFLIGAPRSGTTLIYKTLCAHPDATWITNWLEKFPAVTALSALVRVPPRSPDRRFRVWFGSSGASAYSYSDRRSVSDRLFPMPVEGESLMRRCGIIELGADGTPATRSEQIDGLHHLFAGLQAWSGRSTVINKRIENNRRLPLLAEAFPEARFIEIVRDGRAVAYSMRNVDWWDRLHLPFYGGTVEQWRAEGRDEWEAAARQWVQELDDIDEGRPAVPPENWLRVRYEDVVEDGVPTFEALAEHAGLRPSAEWRAVLDRLRFPNRNESWTEGLSADELSVVEGIQSERLAADGYSLSGP